MSGLRFGEWTGRFWFVFEPLEETGERCVGEIQPSPSRGARYVASYFDVDRGDRGRGWGEIGQTASLADARQLIVREHAR